MASKRITFENGRGETLAARLDLPVDGAPDAYAILAHCFTCSKDLKGLRRLSSALAQEGFAVLRLDFTGLGESEGEFAGTTFTSTVHDLLAAARHLEEHFEAPSLLVGHSLGGAAVLVAAGRIESVRAVATLGAPADPQHVERLLTEERSVIEERGEAQVGIGGRPFTLRREFLEDLRRSELPGSLSELRVPLLVLHSPVDGVVGIDNARRLFEAAHHPKSFVSVDGADHLLTDEVDATYAGGVIASWAGRYVGRQRAPWKRDLHDNRVVARTEGGLRTEILADGFGIVADEPVAVGGTATGPTPYDLLGAALGACTTMTLRLYADRKGWPLEAAEVRVRHAKVHAADSHRDAQTGGRSRGAKLDRFDRELELHGPLDEAQRARLLEIANRCPVHRTLHEGPVEIATSLAPGGVPATAQD
jgi:uncharacterized OsmC-like protein/pimeloyl-ACP methyl ester carboxylesterase